MSSPPPHSGQSPFINRQNSFTFKNIRFIELHCLRRSCPPELCPEKIAFLCISAMCYLSHYFWYWPKDKWLWLFDWPGCVEYMTSF